MEGETSGQTGSPQDDPPRETAREAGLAHRGLSSAVVLALETVWKAIWISIWYCLFAPLFEQMRH